MVGFVEKKPSYILEQPETRGVNGRKKTVKTGLKRWGIREVTGGGRRWREKGREGIVTETGEGEGRSG